MVNRIVYAVKTHQGHVRSNNEDNFYLNGQYKHDVWQNQAALSGTAAGECFLAAVGDGMGGEECGEQASLRAVESLQSCHFEDVYSVAMESVAEANGKICDLMRQNDGKRSGSTLAALYIDSGKAISCNLGDSRAYRLRDGEFLQLSVDHLEKREQTRKKAPLTQHLGISPENFLIEPYIAKGELKRGDQYLLCSDGLTDMLTNLEIDGIMSSTESAEDCVKKLIDAALEKGGKDNVTAIVCRIF